MYIPSKDLLHSAASYPSKKMLTRVKFEESTIVRTRVQSTSSLRIHSSIKSFIPVILRALLKLLDHVFQQYRRDCFICGADREAEHLIVDISHCKYFVAYNAINDKEDGQENS